MPETKRRKLYLIMNSYMKPAPPVMRMTRSKGFFSDVAIVMTSAGGVCLKPLTDANIRAFKLLCMNQLPVRVEDRLFAEMVKAPAGFTHAGRLRCIASASAHAFEASCYAAYVDTMMVGGIASILEPVGGGAFNVVVQALAVLPAYRRNRIGKSVCLIAL